MCVVGLAFEEAVTGAEKTVVVDVQGSCKACEVGWYKGGCWPALLWGSGLGGVGALTWQRGLAVELGSGAWVRGCLVWSLLAWLARPLSLSGFDALKQLSLRLAEPLHPFTPSPLAQGSGMLAPGGLPNRCSVCSGSGRMMRTVWQPSGVRVSQMGECPACAGRGVEPSPPCHTWVVIVVLCGHCGHCSPHAVRGMVVCGQVEARV